MMYNAIGQDNLNVVKVCLENSGVITDNVMSKVLICHPRKTYTFLLESQAVDVNHYIPWFGDILSNAALADDFELCLEHGADPNRNLVDEHKSILAAAAELASVKMAALLVENGARIKGSGAIVLAAAEGKLEMVEYLLDQGADIDEIGIEHPTDERYREDVGSSLHRAVNGKHLDVVKFLMENGADVNLKDLMGRTPLELAQARRNTALVKILKDSGAVIV